MEYFSCKWIESGLVLDLSELKFCCIPHSNNTKGFVPICKYEGGAIPAERIREERRKLIALNNREGVDSPCKGCHYLEKKEWTRPEGGGRFDRIEISSFSLCNLRCTYCYTVLHEDWGLPAVAYDLLPVFRDMVDNGLLARGAKVEWGGGEPTILKDFSETARLLMQHDVWQRIFTNAIRYSDDIEEGLRQGKVAVVTSVDAGDRETYEKIKGRDRFEIVWRNLARYAATGGEVEAKYILRRGNSDPANVRRFVDKCVEAGIRTVTLTPDLEEIAQDTLTEETAYAFALLRYRAKRRGLKVVILPQYLNSANRKRALKYVPLQLFGWRYHVLRATELLRNAARTAWIRARLIRTAGKTRDAIRRAEACVATGQCSPEALTELLDYQTRHPDEALRSRLAEAVHTAPVAGKHVIDERVTALGISSDGWTLNGDPCYLVVDGRSAVGPLVQELWLACTADAATLPLTLTISDGLHPRIVYRYHRPERARIALPAVPAGRFGIFVVNTDKSWSPVEGEDPRRLGVNIATRP